MRGIFVCCTRSTHGEVLRFFEDGTVLSAHMPIPNRDEDWQEVRSWFQPDGDAPVARGSYQLVGDQLSFTLCSPYGCTSYAGSLSDAILRLELKAGGPAVERSYERVAIGDGLSPQPPLRDGEDEPSAARRG